MTDPAFAIKNQVQHLIDIQIDTLRKPTLLTSSELDEYRSRSERITILYRKLDLIARKRFYSRPQRPLECTLPFGGQAAARGSSGRAAACDLSRRA
jgi:hypothetical protein